MDRLAVDRKPRHEGGAETALVLALGSARRAVPVMLYADDACIMSGS